MKNKDLKYIDNEYESEDLTYIEYEAIYEDEYESDFLQEENKLKE